MTVKVKKWIKKIESNMSPLVPFFLSLFSFFFILSFSLFSLSLSVCLFSLVLSCPIAEEKEILTERENFLREKIEFFSNTVILLIELELFFP